MCKSTKSFLPSSPVFSEYTYLAWKKRKLRTMRIARSDFRARILSATEGPRVFGFGDSTHDESMTIMQEISGGYLKSQEVIYL